MSVQPEKIRHLIELLFFSYRNFTKGPDEMLAKFGLGRAHHRALYFIAKNPGITVSDLLKILSITKQSLARVLKELVQQNYVIVQAGTQDRRQRCLFLSDQGRLLEADLFDMQARLLDPIFTQVGPESLAEFEQILSLMVDPSDPLPLTKTKIN